MKVVLQRVKNASVIVDAKTVGEISTGVLLLLGVTHDDQKKDVDFLVNKIANLRIFPSEKSHFDFSLIESQGEILVVSQFTLYGSTQKGRRPDFIEAAKPDVATPLYEYFVEECKKLGLKVQTGIFGADMKVQLTNDGPVTLIIDSKNNAN